MSFTVDNHSKQINVIMSQMTITSCAAISIKSSTCIGANIFKIYQLHLESSGCPAKSKYAVILLYFEMSCSSIPNQSNLSTHIELNSCEIMNLYKHVKLLCIYTKQNTYPQYPILIHMINSTFCNLNNTQIVYGRTLILSKRKPLVELFLTNSTFKHINTLYLIDMIEILVIIQGQTYFTNIKCTGPSSCISTNKELIRFKNYTEFSYIESNVFLRVEYMILERNTIVNFTSNKFEIGIMVSNSVNRRFYLLCVFHYMDTPNAHKTLGKEYDKNDYLIIFKNNSGDKLFSKRHSTSHCSWTEKSVFSTSDPAVINKQFIEYSNNSFNTNNITN